LGPVANTRDRPFDIGPYLVRATLRSITPSPVPQTTDIATYLDRLLGIPGTPDAPAAMNGLQVANRGEVAKIAAAVDASQRTIDSAVAEGADFLLVHHGLFWKGVLPIAGAQYRRLRTLFDHDVAVYSAHIPLDLHPVFGNNVLLAKELGLVSSGEFARYGSVMIGVRGSADLPTTELVDRAARFARGHGGDATGTECSPDRRTRSWAMCSGAGASAETLDEAVALGVDTLIVGEGPHWTAVDAPERGLVIIYAGHYATETPGVRALAQDLSSRFGVPWVFVPAPTGR
jgi:dinuclear metal center YbgI/SA1388 family protein